MVAAMTARAESGVRAACASAGMAECLAKPLDPAALYRLLDRVVVGLRELGARGGFGAGLGLRGFGGVRARHSFYSPGTPLIDEAALLEGLDGDLPFMRKLLGIFIEEADGHREAIVRAVAGRDLDTLQRLCHGLKGSSLSLHANAVGGLAGEVELACIKARRRPPRDEAFGSIAKSVDELGMLLADTTVAARAMVERVALLKYFM